MAVASMSEYQGAPSPIQTMSYTLEACSVADGEALAVNNVSAFWTDPTWVLLWDVPFEQVLGSAKKRWPWNVLRNRETNRHVKALDSDGKLVGYARWELPESRKDCWLKGQVPEVTKEDTMKFMEMHRGAAWNTRSDMDALDGPVHKKMAAIKAGKEFISLEYLAVHPDFRGNGVATLLVRNGIEEAEKMGLKIFVLAFKAGLNIYLKAGFKLVDQLIQDDSKYGGKGEYGTYFLVYEVSGNGQQITSLG